MVCIYCSAETGVVNSRLQKRSNTVWRRRKCLRCSAIFTTQESVDYTASLQVQKSAGHLEPFSRDKLLISILGSLQHRSAPLEDAGSLAETVISKLLATNQKGIFKAQQIVDTVTVALQRFDKVAAMHYQAFHPLD